MAMVKALLLWAVAHVSATDAEKRPVTKVVNLLKEMQTSLAEEAKEDEDTYEKMQCWCKTNGDEKAKSIEEAKSHVKALESRVEELAATSSRLGTEIAGAKDEVAKNEVALDTAVELRKKQVAEFQADEKDLTQSATSVDKALDVIGSNQSSFLQMPQGKMLNALTQLQSVLSKHERLLTKSQRQKIEELVKNPMKFRSAFLQAAPSGGVAGVLSGLKDDFAGQLTNLQKQETEDLKAHEGLVKAKTEEIEAGKKQLEAKTEQKASADLERQQSKQDIKDTEASLSADGSMSSEVKEKCSAMDADYEKRSKVRSDEQAAVSKAIEVLAADEAHDVFGKTFGASFLQVASENSNREKAAAVLAAAGKLDARLTTLALTLKLDTFEKVKQSIDEMKADLKKQQAEEVEKKDWCTDEFQKAKLETQDKTRAEQAKLAELESLQGSVATLAADIKSLEDEVAEMNKQLQLAGQNREKENKEFQKTVMEQRQSQELLKGAMASLKKFYQAEPALIQTKRTGDEPEFKDYKQQSSSFNVLSMLQQLVADAKAMEAEASHAESTAQEDYEAFAKATSASVETKQKQTTTKSEEKGSTEASLVEARQAKEGLGSELSELAALTGQLHDQCDWLMQSFDVRQSARSDEMESLDQAKAMLSGAKA
ncbi:unnamed protein product [Effrenium voratum]|nr:unnamed protein product [Effrenium voratum]|eukprot:CAMPEP_0181457748 /NCGR_PEP_ID=MMETSP1110-20121109/31947_1 /TAXON_ID=174948 /ORGANISM="Symbiodinium sp., Strain CCMP421" /LENGTH=654 /DNA_ID=CAMNT_0023582201 /DNA_START=38 /DNA_END=2002 /DNA_ORIENTATION=+